MVVQATTPPPAPPAPQRQPASHQSQVTAALASIMVAGVSAQAGQQLAARALGTVGVGPRAARAAWRLGTTRRLSLVTGQAKNVPITVTARSRQVVGPAEVAERSVAATWRAAYVQAAGERIQRDLDAGKSLEEAIGRERRFFDLHVAAQRNRQQAARAVDQAAADRPDAEHALLGWYAHEDDRTTPECRWADGRNFYADRRPVFGWPGAVHVRCRCRPGPPHRGGRLLYAAPARLLRKGAR